jgi:hypothetical protein
MKLVKADFFAILSFLGLLILFYPELFLARQASLMGDHWEQHYPWAFVMSEALRGGRWPFWTSMIQCGFPIAAESQIGIFYLPNILLYFLLPVRWAYAYMNVFHFFVSGAGTYFYLRKIGVRSSGALAAAVVFVFGTGYGGAYYNLTSLKTIAWMPWILWSFEKYLERFRIRYALGAAVAMFLAIVAGYLQVAALMIAICLLYFLLRICIFPDDALPRKKWGRAAGGVLIALGGAVLLSLPQLVLSYELALFSNRINLSEDYAYVGSLSPPVLLTILFPKLQGLFRGNCLYSGILSLYFVFAAYFVSRTDLRRQVWLWTVMTVTALFLALGQWSPLYVALIKVSHFYSFRVPAKFLIFICFGFAVLVGLGVHAWQEELVKTKDRLGSLNRSYLFFAGGMLAIWGAVYLAVTAGRPMLIRIGEWVVGRFIFGKTGHPRSLEDYLATVNSLADYAQGILSPKNPWQLWALVLILTSILWVLLQRRILKNPRGIVGCLSVAGVVLFADLYVFSAEDIKRDFDSYANVMKSNAVVLKLREEKAAGRLGRVYGFRRQGESLPIVPSVNMFYGIEDIGGYSPFVMSRYFETVGQFGNVNDSNRMVSPEPGFVLARLPLLRALGVSHILSTQALAHPDLELQVRDGESGSYLYRDRGLHDRGYFVSGDVRFGAWPSIRDALLAPGFDPVKTLWFEEAVKTETNTMKPGAGAKAIRIERTRHEEGREVWALETTGPGYFVVSNTMYPGWRATLNGSEVPIFRAYGIFQAVFVPLAGKHRVEFIYQPYQIFWRKA